MTAMGSLLRYITHSDAIPFQPMNINFGLFPPLPGKHKGRDRRLLLGRRALREMEKWKVENEE
jgi:methylenetetrahydrofolate--tRNA-(uracil-5-)-methyltransferase